MVNGTSESGRWLFRRVAGVDYERSVLEILIFQESREVELSHAFDKRVPDVFVPVFVVGEVVMIPNMLHCLRFQSAFAPNEDGRITYSSRHWMPSKQTKVLYSDPHFPSNY